MLHNVNRVKFFERCTQNDVYTCMCMAIYGLLHMFVYIDGGHLVGGAN